MLIQAWVCSAGIVALCTIEWFLYSMCVPVPRNNLGDTFWASMWTFSPSLPVGFLGWWFSPFVCNNEAQYVINEECMMWSSLIRPDCDDNRIIMNKLLWWKSTPSFRYVWINVDSPSICSKFVFVSTVFVTSSRAPESSIFVGRNRKNYNDASQRNIESNNIEPVLVSIGTGKIRPIIQLEFADSTSPYNLGEPTITITIAF